MQAALPELGEQLTADIALVGVELARQVLGHFVQHGAVGGVARGDPQRHDLAFVVDHDVQLEAVKPPNTGLGTCGQAVKDLVAVDTAGVGGGGAWWCGGGESAPPPPAGGGGAQHPGGGGGTGGGKGKKEGKTWNRHGAEDPTPQGK